MDFSTVQVDDHAVPASAYIGNPTDNEAVAIVLVHVPSVGDYVFDFENEKYREAPKHEFIRLHFGALSLKSMRAGRFVAPLPFHNLNEFRIAASNGHTVKVQF